MFLGRVPDLGCPVCRCLQDGAGDVSFVRHLAVFGKCWTKSKVGPSLVKGSDSVSLLEKSDTEMANDTEEILGKHSHHFCIVPHLFFFLAHICRLLTCTHPSLILLAS